MALIESISDDMITIFLILFTLFLIVISWLSTNVREFPFPGNLLVIERNSRRFYTTIDGNRTLITSQNGGNSVTATTTVINNLNSNASGSTNSDFIASPNSRQSPPSTQNINRESSFSIDSRHEIVDEIVEQALVENLLEGTLFTPSDISSTSHDTSAVASNDSINNIESSSVNSANSDSTSSTNRVNNSNQSIDETSSNELKPLDAETNAADESPMNILIRFVNEREMKIQAKPTDTILLIKRTHFENELSSNKIVRFIYQGQFLCDKNTIKSYNIKDKTTIHCHITTKPASVVNSSSTDTDANNTSLPSVTVTSNPRARNVHNHQIATINRINQMSTNTATTITATDNPGTDNITLNDGLVTHSSDSTPLSQQQQQVQGESDTLESTTSSNTDQPQQTNVPIINIALSHLLLPLFAILISSLWYFRINFKHFFSPLSTLILVVFTFVYGVFLINNVHATTAIAAANFFFHNRIWRNNRNIQRQQTTTSTAAATVPIQANSTSSSGDLD